MSRNKRRRPIAPPAPPEQGLPFCAPVPMMPLLNVQVLGAKNATVASVVLSRFKADSTGFDYRFEVAEASKREQGDVFDPVTGEMLAVARALQRLSRELFSEAGKRVKASTEAQEAALARRKAKRAPKADVPRRTREGWLRELHKRYLADGGTLTFPQWCEAEGHLPEKPAPSSGSPWQPWTRHDYPGPHASF